MTEPRAAPGVVGAVARGRAGLYPGPGGQTVHQIGRIGQQPGQRIALVALVPGVQHGTVDVHQHGLDRGGAQVDAQIERARGLGQPAARRGVLTVTVEEIVVFGFGIEQGRQAGAGLALKRTGCGRVRPVRPRSRARKPRAAPCRGCPPGSGPYRAPPRTGRPAHPPRLREPCAGSPQSGP